MAVAIFQTWFDYDVPEDRKLSGCEFAVEVEVRSWTTESNEEFQYRMYFNNRQVCKELRRTDEPTVLRASVSADGQADAMSVRAELNLERFASIGACDELLRRSAEGLVAVPQFAEFWDRFNAKNGVSANELLDLQPTELVKIAHSSLPVFFLCHQKDFDHRQRSTVQRWIRTADLAIAGRETLRVFYCQAESSKDGDYWHVAPFT